MGNEPQEVRDKRKGNKLFYLRAGEGISLAGV